MNAEKGLDLVHSVKSVSRETQQRLTDYCNLLQQWQTRINLISPNTVDQIWERHIADSMQCAVLAGEPSHLVDIGSGAGFPGMVMALVMAESGEGKVSFIESVGKKCAFLTAVIRQLKLKETGLDIAVHHGRIEQVLPQLQQPDVISARALAPLSDLFRLTDPCLREQGFALFPKGRDYQQEINKAEKDWKFTVETKQSLLEPDSVLLKISHINPR